MYKVGTKVVLKESEGVNPSWLGYVGTIVDDSDMAVASVSFQVTPHGRKNCTQVISWGHLSPVQISNYGREEDV